MFGVDSYEVLKCRQLIPCMAQPRLVAAYFLSHHFTVSAVSYTKS